MRHFYLLRAVFMMYLRGENQKKVNFNLVHKNILK